jgi:hypothetical protein
MLMIAAGYEDGIDANALRADPLFKMALERLPGERDLCSQSTVSRLEKLPDRRMLLRMARAMVGLYCASGAQVPTRITLDIDDTFDAVHGGQQLRLFNAHYDDYGFQPIVVFEAIGPRSRSCSAATGTTARPRCWTSAAPGASTSGVHHGARRGSRRRHGPPVQRNSATPPPPGAASSASSPASRPGRAAATPGSSSPA